MRSFSILKFEEGFDDISVIKKNTDRVWTAQLVVVTQRSKLLSQIALKRVLKSWEVSDC